MRLWNQRLERVQALFDTQCADAYRSLVAIHKKIHAKTIDSPRIYTNEMK